METRRSMQTVEQTGRLEEANSRLSQFCESAGKLKDVVMCAGTTSPF